MLVIDNEQYLIGMLIIIVPTGSFSKLSNFLYSALQGGRLSFEAAVEFVIIFSCLLTSSLVY